MLQLLQQMQNQLVTLSNQPPTNHQGGYIGGRGGQGRGRGNDGRRNGPPGYRGRRNMNNYCWTHGACSHTSKDCENPREGHQYDATFDNKMNGSRYYCN